MVHRLREARAYWKPFACNRLQDEVLHFESRLRDKAEHAGAKAAREALIPCQGLLVRGLKR